MKLAYISPHFPKARHGFEAAELVELAGVYDVSVISLRKPSGEERLWLAQGFGKLDIPIESLRLRDLALGLSWALAHRPRTLFGSIAAYVALGRHDVVGSSKALLSLAAGVAALPRLRAGGAAWIHADFASAPASAALVASRLLNVPWSFMGHAFDVFSTKPAGGATVPLLAMKLREASVTFAENEEAKRRLDAIASDFGLGTECRLRRNGIDIEGKEDIGAPTRFTVVGLGALVEKKGFDVLLRAARIVQDHEPVAVEIHGEGPERARLERLGREIGVNVRLPGAFTHSDLPAIMKRASVVVAPSRLLSNGDSDGVPTVLIEAMAFRRPVVATAVGSITDLVRDGETGQLVSSEDPHALAEAILDIAREPEVTRARAERGYRLVQAQFTSRVALEVFAQAIGDAA